MMTEDVRGGGKWTGADDAALCRAAAAGDRDALECLYRRHADRVYGAAYRVTGSATDAEDVLQDVFVGLPRALRGYVEDGRFPGWLKTVATRTALMRVRASERRGWEALPGGLPSRESPPDRAVDRVTIRRALAEMPEALRAVFLLKEVDGYDHGEIGALLGIRPATSRVRLHRAWAFLDARLSEEDR